jgi:hypothetical protein
MDEFVKQQITDEFLKEMFFQLREHSFSQVSLLDGADGKTTAPLTSETVYAGDATQFQMLLGSKSHQSRIPPSREVRGLKQ